MKDLKSHIRIAGLIQKEFLGEISKIEEQILEKWKSESNNLNVYMEIKAKILAREHHKQYCDIDLHESWMKMNNQLKGEFRKIRVRAFYRYAAVFVAVAIISSLFFIVDLPKDRIAQNTQIDQPLLPGTEKATLILSNGEKIELDADAKNNILDPEGVAIKNSNRVLSYDKGADQAGSSMVYNTIVTPMGGEYQLILADGTRVWLNAMSKIKYPALFQADERRVELEGEACFEVVKNQKKPFIVQTSRIDVKVLGTEFNVMAYSDEQAVQTTLVEGAVQVNVTEGGLVIDSKIIAPNQQLHLNKISNEVSVREVNASFATAWKNGRFVCNDENLEMIMRKLSRWYDLEVTFESRELKGLVYTVNLKKYDHCQSIFNIIEYTREVAFEVNGNKVFVKKSKIKKPVMR